MNTQTHSHFSRRGFLAAGAATLAVPAALRAQSTGSTTRKLVTPPTGRQILLSPKLGMLPKELNGRKLTLVERLSLAGDAGFDGVDFDQAGEWTAEEARQAVLESGVFVHNAINHAHWSKRLTSANDEDRAEGVKNIAHCQLNM